MTERWTRQEVAGKVDWEGGVADAIQGYGLDVDVLPEDTPTEVVEAWIRVRESRKDVDLIADWLGD